MNFREAVEYLYSLGHETLAMKFGLAATSKLLSSLGNPQQHYPKIQIAGTNGKGSTAAFIDSICYSAGINTGLFTSPHLIEITERIRLGGKDISQESFALHATKVRNYAEKLVESGDFPALPTFFEQVTAIALDAFAHAHSELAILETGLGGRLDSTTAARAEIAVITPIDIDHREYLGDTIDEIAAEKAAIIHEESAAIIAPQNEIAAAVIAARCREVGIAPLVISGNEWHSSTATTDGRFVVDFELPGGSLSNVTLGLRGRHQISNAGVAIAAVLELRTRGFMISDSAIKQGLESAQHPGRLELVNYPFPILLDGAHNPHGAQALAEFLQTFCPASVTLIFGAMRDKDIVEVLKPLKPLVKTLILTEIDNPRTATIEQMKSAVDALAFTSEIVTSNWMEEAFRLAAERSTSGVMTCVAGSLYLVGEARRLLLGKKLAE